MVKNSQSPVPDLIYESQQMLRVADIKPYMRLKQQVPQQMALHRLTVFLTYACNLTCPYCKTIVRNSKELHQFPQRAASYRLEHFKQLLDSLEDTPVQHLHFTGGEATLIPELPEMVLLARQRGISFVSLTSNGTQSISIYMALIEAGIHEIRISLDAANATLGKQLTQRSGAWEKTILTIKNLARQSQQRPYFFLIINTVVGFSNRQELPRLLDMLLKIGPPDDIKFITEADVRNELGDFTEQQQVKEQIQKLLEPYSPERFPLLRRKLTTVFQADAVGLDSISSNERPWHCYISLTERTVDRQYYYPCSVYLREGGRPLGEISESQQEQREKTLRFVKEENCLADPICQKYCLHCTREFNRQANLAREALY